jgi:hypothetical protein
VQVRLDDGTYPTGVKVTSAQMAALPVSRTPRAGTPRTDRLAAGQMDELIAQLLALRQAQREDTARPRSPG